jgi:hypothetical protein
VASEEPELLVITIGGTTGWGAAGRELAAGLRAAGADVRLVQAQPPARVRTFMLTDLSEAWNARQVSARALAQRAPAAIIYCSVTAALLWPRPGAIWLDTLAAESRPGRHGVWQRIVERRRLGQAPLIMTMAERPLGLEREDTVTVPVPVDPSGPLEFPRDIDALAYAGDPVKRRLDFVLEAWSRARREGETLVVAGVERADAPPGVQFTGRLGPEAFRELMRRSRVYVAAARREDYGITPLEALADGCQLVTTPSPGPYPALRLARELDPRLVASDDLAAALRFALDDPRPDYAERAAELLVPFRRASVHRTLAERVLPRLLAR